MYWSYSPYSYSLGRLWYALLVASIIGPFLIGHFWRRRWRFTLKDLLCAAIVLAGVVAWLKDDLRNLVLIDVLGSASRFHAVTSTGAPLSHPDCRPILFLLGLSTIFAWGVFAKRSCNGQEPPRTP